VLAILTQVQFYKLAVLNQVIFDVGMWPLDWKTVNWIQVNQQLLALQGFLLKMIQNFAQVHVCLPNIVQALELWYMTMTTFGTTKVSVLLT